MVRYQIASATVVSGGSSPGLPNKPEMKHRITPASSNSKLLIGICSQVSPCSGLPLLLTTVAYAAQSDCCSGGTA